MRKLLCVVSFWAILNAVSFGLVQDKTNISETDDEGIPEAKHVAEIKLPTGRVIPIHKGGSRTPNVYYHKPILAFIENKDDDRDKTLPTIVQSNPTIKDGLTYLQFNVVLSTDNFQRVCEEQVRNQDLTLRKTGTDSDLGLVRCRRWPLKQARIRIIHLATKEVLAEGATENLVNSGDNFLFSAGFTEAALKTFREEAPKKNKIGFIFSYTDQSVVEEMASLSTRATATLGQSLEKALDIIKKKPDDPLFQNQYTEVKQNLNTILRQVIYATQKDLIPMLQSDPVSKLFEKPVALDISKLESTDEKLQSQAAEYIKPLLREEQKKFEDSKKDKHTTTTTNDVGVKVSVPTGKDGSTDFNVSQKSVDELSKEHGITFSEQTDTKTLMPTAIRVYRLSQAWQQNSLDALQQIFLRTGFSTKYKEDSPVSPQFTLAELKEIDDLNGGLKPFSGFWPGMTVCQLSNVLPPGFVWADGKSDWPDENWVPAQLKGKRVPDLSDVVMGSTNDNSQVGIIWNKGRLQIPESFLKESSSTEAAQPQVYALKYRQLPLIRDNTGQPRVYVAGIFTAPSYVADATSYVFSNVVDSAGYMALTEVKSPTYKYQIGTPSIPLDKSSTNPVNFQCRWMIKVR